MFHLTSAPVLSEVDVTFLSLVIILTANGKFWIVPLLHSVKDMYVGCSSNLVLTSCITADVWNSNQEMLCLPSPRDNATYFQESCTRCCSLLIRPTEIKIVYSVTLLKDSPGKVRNLFGKLDIWEECTYSGRQNFIRRRLVVSASVLHFFFLRRKMCFRSHVPSSKHQVTVRFIDHSKIQDLQPGTCFMSPFWRPKFGCCL